MRGRRSTRYRDAAWLLKGQPTTDAGRLPLFVTIGFSVLLHGLFITGLPNLPWISRPPDIFRLTRYVVRFAKPVPTSVPVLTQVAVAEPVPIEPAPVEPVADLQTPKPIERAETQPEHAVEPLPALAPVQPVVPKPPDLQQRTASQTRQRVETQPEHAVEPLPALAPVQPVVPKPPDLQQRTASQTRQRVETQPEHVVEPQVAPPTVQPVVPKPRTCSSAPPHRRGSGWKRSLSVPSSRKRRQPWCRPWCRNRRNCNDALRRRRGSG